jgi:hypothetical protein
LLEHELHPESVAAQGCSSRADYGIVTKIPCRFRPLALLPAVLSMAAGCAGSGGAPTAPTAAAPTFQLAGTVRDASALIPLAGVRVSAADGLNTGKSTTSDAAGRYTLTGLVADSFTLRTQSGGYEDHLQDVRITQHTNVDIRLIPKRSVNSGWTQGQLYFMAEGARAGNRLSDPVVTQNGTQVSGTASTAEGGTASFSGRLEGTRFIGSIRAEVAFGSPLKRCRGFAPIAEGRMTGDSIQLAADTMGLENCAGVLSVTRVELSIQP